MQNYNKKHENILIFILNNVICLSFTNLVMSGLTKLK